MFKHEIVILPQSSEVGGTKQAYIMRSCIQRSFLSVRKSKTVIKLNIHVKSAVLVDYLQGLPSLIFLNKAVEEHLHREKNKLNLDLGEVEQVFKLVGSCTKWETLQ